MKRPRIRTPQLPGPKAKAIIERDQDILSPSLSRPYPFVAEKGEGVWLKDSDGNEFLDFTAGIAVTSTGHCHPRVVRAIQDQATKLLHMSGTDFYYDVQVKLAEKLAQIAPWKGKKKVFFTNSGAEAVEAAIKLARYHTGREKLIAFFGAFHGRTLGALSLTASRVVQREKFGPLLPGVHHVGYGYCYRCPYNLKYPQCDIACVSYLEDTLFKKTVPPEEVAAIIVEPIQGEGGLIMPPPGYHEALRELTRKHKILLIVDEIQAGMGRTGKMFAIEHWGVEPDIITVAKGIASGMPLGAMIAKSELVDWEPGSHANTFGGNPVACRAALETIDLIESKLMENAKCVGEYLKAELLDLGKKYPLIGDVRGAGLMLGIELVRNRETKEPAVEERNKIVQKAFRRGLLLLGCGECGIRFTPPLVVTKSEVDIAIGILERCLKIVSR
ncbi:MAG: acetyl ornithine aminotransferase family protein [Candidatus Omnitrophica bacterium]|nr:acetyl ornithine aminotransferase family protein [Candidatus Omnitrophota bacterium]